MLSYQINSERGKHMDICNISDRPGLCRNYFTLEELEEMNRDMEFLSQLTDSFTFPRKRRHRSDSNIILLRPDITLPQT